MVNKKPTIIPTTEQVIPIFLKRKLQELGMGLGILAVFLIFFFSATPIGFFAGSFFFEDDCSNYELGIKFNTYCHGIDASVLGVVVILILAMIIFGIYSFIKYNWRASKIEAYNKLNPKNEVSSWNSYRRYVLKEDVGDYW